MTSAAPIGAKTEAAANAASSTKTGKSRLRPSYWPFVLPGLITVGAVIVVPWVFTLWMSANQWQLGGEQSFVGFGDYRENVSGSNLFAADLSGQVAGFTTVKIGADWTSSLTTELDLTAHVGVGTTMANQRTTAYILGGGTTTAGYANTIFAEYGLGLGYHITPQSTIEGFVQGSTGTNIGTHAQIGAAYRMKF